MKLIFKTESEILEELEVPETISDEFSDKLTETYNHKTMLKYEITFKEGVMIKDCHSLEDIKYGIIECVTITIL